MKFKDQLKAGVILDNPIFMQTIGLCPTLATSTSLSNAIGMGVAATIVLICSNIVISALRRFIPDKVRIAAFHHHHCGVRYHDRSGAAGVRAVSGGVPRPVPAADRC